MTRADKVALGASVMALIALYTHFWIAYEPANEVTIATAEGAQTFSLFRDREVRIRGTRGDSIIEISHGRARFETSPCSGKLCIHAGWLARAGDTAACVPNGVIVSLAGRDTQYDAVNF
jgi:hypothetical protein